MPSIAENLAEVRGRIAAAAARAGRKASEITLLAVTKYTGLAEIEALMAAGCTELGESRPQQLWQRAAALSDRPVHWHMIGHLQRNKVARTLPLVAMIQSVDSLRLAVALDEEAGKISRRVPVLLEVNISGEVGQARLGPGEHRAGPGRVGRLWAPRNPRSDVHGRTGGRPRSARGATLPRSSSLGERLRRSSPAELTWHELSMGMSGDYEIAIEEGATIVRVGSALFEEIRCILTERFVDNCQARRSLQSQFSPS